MIRPIRTEKDYELALGRVESLMDAKPNRDEFDELEVLATLVDNYEAKYYAIDMPNQIEAIKFRIEQEGLIQNDLVALFGKKSRVSEVLNKAKNEVNELTKKLQLALEEVEKLERGEVASKNARDFLDEK